MSELPEGLTAERVKIGEHNGVKYTKTLPDGTQHSATLFLWPPELIAELRSCVAVNQARWERDRKWWRRALRALGIERAAESGSESSRTEAKRTPAKPGGVIAGTPK